MSFQNSKKQSNLDRLKKLFIKCSLLTKFDCYSKIFEYENNLKAKMIWSLILFFMVGFTFWLLSLNILDFLKHEVLTKTEEIFSNPTQFPTVTICDNYPFTTDLGYNFVQNISKANNVSDNFSAIFQAKMKAADPSFGDINRQSLGTFNLTKFLKCSFRTKKFDCAKHFRWYY